jgi:hypothetical protein
MPVTRLRQGFDVATSGRPAEALAKAARPGMTRHVSRVSKDGGIGKIQHLAFPPSLFYHDAIGIFRRPPQPFGNLP